MTPARLALVCLAILVLLLGGLVAMQHMRPTPPPHPGFLAGRPPMSDGNDPLLPEDMISGPSFEVISLTQAAQLVEERFNGKLIAARLVPPFPHEFAEGVELVHELRFLTPSRHVLTIRLDARTGRFLEVAGAGLAQARKQKGAKK